VVTFAVQYLEDGPGVAALAPADASARLRAAFGRLPISLVLLGWTLPQVLVQACGDEASRTGADLFRWHPLLAGDGTFVPRPEWRPVGLDDAPVPGFRALPQFTFVCPNRSAVRDAVLHHLDGVLHSGDYRGVFLDRIRCPSPSANPGSLLACFCQECQRAASAEGFDLEAAQREIRSLVARREDALPVGQTLLDPIVPASSNRAMRTLRRFLDFRMRSVARLVEAAADLVHERGLAVGLDCFSPCLAYVVGQDLALLDRYCDWIKIMTYGHALGPAGLLFELLGLADWPADQ